METTESSFTPNAENGKNNNPEYDKNQEIKDLAFHYVDRIRETAVPLKTLLKDEEARLRKKIIKYIHREVKKELLPQLKELSNEIYLAMLKSGKWGPLGEMRITLSFNRHLLNIPSNGLIYLDHKLIMDRFIEILNAKLGYKSGEELIQYCKQKTILLFGMVYSEFDKLRDFIALLDAPYYFYSSNGPFCEEFIFGKIKWKTLDEIRIYTYVKEWARSPSHITGIVARGPNKNKPIMQIRSEGLFTVFYNKWRDFFIFEEPPTALTHPNDVLEYGFRKTTLGFCDIKSYAEFQLINPYFLMDGLLRMRDEVIAHEMGHYIISIDSDPTDRSIYYTFSEEDNVLVALEETMADWAPQRGTKTGAILRYAEIGKNNPVIGNLVGWKNCSDIWFLHKMDPNTFILRSHTMAGLKLAFVKRNKTFDNDAIIFELPMIYETAAKLQRSIIHGIRDILFTFQYEKGNKTYRDVDNEIISSLQEEDQSETAEELRQKFKYWNHLKDNYIKTDPVLEETINDYLAKQGDNLVQEVFTIIGGILKRRKIKKHYASLWDFIVSRCKEIGVYKVK